MDENNLSGRKIFKIVTIFLVITCINGEFLPSSFGQSVQGRQKTGRRFVEEKQELQTGILVVHVFPDSAAENAGIKVGDIILRINRRYVVSEVQEFVDFIKNVKGGNSIITIKSDGLKKNIIVNLPPAGESPRLGVTVSDLVSKEQSSLGNQKLSSNTALAQATRKVDYVPPSSLSQKLKEINVLKYVLIDKETSRAVFIGNYDPDYSSGPISYHDLLSDALKDPYPSFSFDIDHEIYRSQIREIQRIMDVEMRKISTDLEYGIEWMNKTMMSIIKSKDSIPEKLILEQRMRQKMGIEPNEWMAYFDWNPKSNTNTYSQYEKIGSFLGKLFTSLGIEERFGRALIVLHQAQREVRENTSNYETTSKLCGLLGTMDGLYEIRDDLGSNRINDETAGRRLWSLHYGALLKGFGVPSSKVDAMTDRYKKGYCWDEELAQAVEERYEFLAKEALRLHVFQSLIFSQDFLRTIYRNLPIAFSGVKLYGRSADSPLIRVMFDADYAFKYITIINPETVSIPGHQSSLEFLTAEENRLGISLPDEGGVRYWIKPGVVKMESFQDKSGVYFVSADLGIGAEPLRSHLQLNAFRESLNSYAAGLTKRYDAYARLYPSLHIMREAEKIIAFTRWVKKNNIVVKIDEFKPVKDPVPDKVKGFVSIVYVSKEKGDMDHFFLDINGGVVFDQEEGEEWIEENSSEAATDDVMHQLAASTALAEQSAEAAIEGDFEEARDLAEKSAEAMTGSIDVTQMSAMADLPIPTPQASSVSVGTQAAVSEEVVFALDKNLQAAAEAHQQIADSETLRKTLPPVQYEEKISSAQNLKQRSDDNLQYLKELLTYYRNNSNYSQKVIAELRNLDPSQPAAVKLLRMDQSALIQKAPSIDEAIPKREKLLGELKELQLALSRTRMALMRLNRSVQADSVLFKEWQDQAEKSIDNAQERAQNFIKDNLSNELFNLLKWKSLNMPKRVKEIERFEELISVKEFADWAQIDKHSWEDIGEGLVSASQNLPLSAGVQTVVTSMQSIIDSGYDITAWFISWRRIQQLEKNSDAYLLAVQKISKQMNSIVSRIKDIESQL